MSYKNRGLSDWLVQRATAVYLMLYFIPLLYLLFTSGPNSFFMWKSFFHFTGMKIATVLAVLCIALHAWIGLWTVFTDYVKCSSLRLVLQALVILVLAAYVIWGAVAVWAI